MWSLGLFVFWVWFLYKPLPSVLSSMFWTSMELASIRDPHLHDAAVKWLGGD